MTEVVYICGMGRSGTTVLQHYLASKFDFSVTSETGLLKALFSNSGMQISLEQTVPRLSRITSSSKEILIVPKLASQVLLKYIEILSPCILHDGKPILDKDPSFVHHTVSITELGSVRFIATVRHPVACFESRKRAKWSSGKGYIKNLLAVAFELHSVQRIQNNKNVFIVQFEKFILNSHSVEEFLIESGISYRDKRIDVCLVDETEEEWKKGVTGPLNEEKLDGWRKNIPAPEKLFLEGFFWSLPFGKRYIKFVWRIEFIVGAIVSLSTIPALYYAFARFKRFR